jgi:hypothetical protein
MDVHKVNSKLEANYIWSSSLTIYIHHKLLRLGIRYNWINKNNNQFIGKSSFYRGVSSNPGRCYPCTLEACTRPVPSKGLYFADQSQPLSSPSCPALPMYCTPDKIKSLSCKWGNISCFAKLIGSKWGMNMYVLYTCQRHVLPIVWYLGPDCVYSPSLRWLLGKICSTIYVLRTYGN